MSGSTRHPTKVTQSGAGSVTIGKPTIVCVTCPEPHDGQVPRAPYQIATMQGRSRTPHDAEQLPRRCLRFPLTSAMTYARSSWIS